MKKTIIASMSMTLALLMVFVFTTSTNNLTPSQTIASTCLTPTEPTLEAHEMPASLLKETLLAQLQATQTTSSKEQFFLEHSSCSSKLIACLLMAKKDHAAARSFLQSKSKLMLEQLQALRHHEATRDAMAELELLEGRNLSVVAQRVSDVVSLLDVLPTEDDVDERCREISRSLKHIAIIPDGNRRWARERGLNPSEGHKKGFLEVAPDLFQEAWQLGIHTFTLWCCSTSNIDKRDPEEVQYFLYCFNGMIQNILPFAKKNKVRIVHLGRKDRIPESLLKTIQEAEKDTINFDKHVLNVAIDYSGNDEIVSACKKIIQDGISADNITEELLTSTINQSSQPNPNPDLTIRTGNELRTSGFMSWQIGYSELYFTKDHFPSLNKNSFKEAILNFGSRKRRLGK